MWTFLVRFILRYRFYNLIAIFALTAFMAYEASKVQLSYELQEMLPTSDSISIKYKQFKEVFGQDGSVMYIGLQDCNIFKLQEYNDLFDLTVNLKKIEGVQEIVSITRMYQLRKNDSTKKFDFKPISKEKPKTQAELDSLKTLIYSYPFYENLLYNKKSNVFLLMVTLDKQKIETVGRFTLVNAIKAQVELFCSKYKVSPHYSGLPYIRTVTSFKIKRELLLFILLSLLVAAIVLFFYFRSFKAVLIPLLVVAIGVIWALGMMALFDFKITLLTGIIPPLLIIIGVENCIFLLNKYHFEYRNHQNKVKALSRIVQRVGFATMLTNIATAAGFAAFIIIRNRMLHEFGVVASLNIIIVWIISLFLIPILFSYLKPPSLKQTKHLENKSVNRIVEFIVHTVKHKRKLIYVISVIIVLIGAYGVTKLKTTGNIVDDISKKDPLYTDLMFFEKHFHGVMPFEISIDTKKKKGVLSRSMLEKINTLQDTLATYPELSKPLSIVEIVKFAKQAFYDGDPAYYDMPNGNELVFMLSYLPKISNQKKSIINNFVDSTMRKTRISVQMANIGTKDIERILTSLQPKIDTIFNKDYFDAQRLKDTSIRVTKYDVNVTGTSVIFLKGTDYLVTNLWSSLAVATLIISLLMLLMFTSIRMVGISMIPNLIPQILTAAMMGYIGISIKPSTVLIFSIALGISVDNAILYLSRYRYQLKQHRWNIEECVISALKETGYSMIYSSSVLFLGFSIFIFSTFGGTQAVGYLISFTMLIAMLCNLFLLPSMLLTFGKKGTTKAFKEPVIEILHEEDEDIDLKEIEDQEEQNETKTSEKSTTDKSLLE
ncbi:MAG: MMPL family transporter [Bacteroidota bacterium]